MKLVAITGSIGCGKTTLASMVRRLGYCVYDVDGWVRRLYFKKDFIRVIGKHFPQVIEDEKVNKRALRNIVFNDNARLKELEGLIHPFYANISKRLFIGKPAATVFFFWTLPCCLKWAGIFTVTVLSLPMSIMKLRRCG